MPVGADCFLREGRYQAYAYSGTESCPAVTYTSRLPQIMDRQLLPEIPDIRPEDTGAEDALLQAYFSGALRKYPAMFAVRDADAFSRRFEWYEAANYAENGVFAGLSPAYGDDAAEKCSRAEAVRAEQKAQQAAWRIYSGMYRDRCGTLPEFHLTQQEQTWQIPVLLYLSGGQSVQIPLMIAETLRRSTHIIIRRSHT